MPTLTSLDWTNIGHIAEFAGFVLASLVTAFVQARRTDKGAAKQDRDEDGDVQKETIGSFAMLVANYKDRIQELKDELDEAKKAHEQERRIMVHALLSSADNEGIFAAKDLYDLRQIGIEIREQHEQTDGHIKKAQGIADATAQALDADSEGVSDDTALG